MNYFQQKMKPFFCELLSLMRNVASVNGSKLDFLPYFYFKFIGLHLITHVKKCNTKLSWNDGNDIVISNLSPQTKNSQWTW